jgi:hypothetical protein
MRTLLFFIFILLTTATLATAEIRVKESLDLDKSGDEVRTGVQTLCIDGHKFVFAYKWAAKGTRMGFYRQSSPGLLRQS